MSQLLLFGSSSLVTDWESSGGQHKAFGPCTCVGDTQHAPGSRLQTGSAAAVTGLWGMKQMKISLSVAPLPFK